MGIGVDLRSRVGAGLGSSRGRGGGRGRPRAGFSVKGSVRGKDMGTVKGKLRVHAQQQLCRWGKCRKGEGELP